MKPLFSLKAKSSKKPKNVPKNEPRPAKNEDLVEKKKTVVHMNPVRTLVRVKRYLFIN